jgi:hypothetical protein
MLPDASDRVLEELRRSPDVFVDDKWGARFQFYSDALAATEAGSSLDRQQIVQDEIFAMLENQPAETAALSTADKWAVDGFLHSLQAHKDGEQTARTDILNGIKDYLFEELPEADAQHMKSQEGEAQDRLIELCT